jgi:hypothetical protein
MARPTIEPVTDANLAEFARFLHVNLLDSRSAAEWECGLRTQWLPSAGNFGFLLRDNSAVVGGIGAYYAERQVRGRSERFCNITSWCVLDSHRQQSMRLAMALLAQEGYHFTNFSPTQVVSSTLKFLKFKEIDPRVVVFANVPWLHAKGELLCSPSEIEAALDGEALKIYRDHAKFPWLNHVVIGRPQQWCHVIYKRWTYKRLPAAQLLHVGDRVTFERHARALSGHLLARGMVSTHVEARLVGRVPRPSAFRSGFIAKLYLSPTLQQEDIDALYSESVALDL